MQDCPTWLQVHPSGLWLVACHELSAHVGAKEGDGFLSSYSIDEDGGLTRVCTTPTSGRGNTCVAFDHTGRFVLTTRYWEGGVAVLPFNADDGTIAPVSCAPLHKGIGPHPLRQSMPHPHGILGDPKTDLVYAADLGTDCVHQYVLSHPSFRMFLCSAELILFKTDCNTHTVPPFSSPSSEHIRSYLHNSHNAYCS